MRTGWLLITVLVASPVWAQPGGPMREKREERRAERKERRERLRKEMELSRTLRIADELGLDEAAALRISGVLKQGDERREKQRQDLRGHVEELKKMAEGSPSVKDVDGKIKVIQDLRIQQLRSEEETLDAAAKGLTPAQKAKLAVVLGMHERQMRKLMFQEMGEQGGPPEVPEPPATPRAR